MVCPPPKTYTDLNLILIEAENVNMTETMREGLKKKVYGLLQDFALGKTYAGYEFDSGRRKKLQLVQWR